MGNDKKRLTIIEKELKAKEEQRKAEIAAIPPSLSNVPGYGGNRYRPPTPPSPPDWSFWLHMPEVRLWQAVALSMNIDPDSLKGHPQGWMAGPGSGPIFTDNSFSSSEQRVTFDKRLRLLAANKSVKNGFSPGTLSMDHPAYNSVRLSEFSPWAQSIGWDIPAELVAIARKHDEQPGAAAAQKDASVTPAKVSPSGTATSTQDKPQKPKGCTWRDIMAAPWPKQQGFDLAAALSNKIPKWLDNETAIMHRGTAPEPTLWNPAGIAICMATNAPRRKWTMQPRTLDNVIRAHFTEFLQEWEAFLRYR